MRFRLRTLLIALAIMPPTLSIAWSRYAAYRAEQERQRLAKEEVWIDLGGGKVRLFPVEEFHYFVPFGPSTPDSEPSEPSGRIGCYDSFQSFP